MAAVTSVKKGVLFLRLVYIAIAALLEHQKRTWAAGRLQNPSTSAKDVENDAEPENIVIVGASFAGYHAARLIATSLPLNGRYRIVIIEPKHHYQFTWTLPRFCVVEGHEDKTFIPLGPYIPAPAKEFVRWVHGTAASINRQTVTIEETGETIPYSYLVIATGAGVGLTLPSRVGAVGKKEGAQLLRDMQQRIKASKNLVVVGGGAAGVELATDAKQLYPEKKVTLVHSRSAVMHRFGPELQIASLKAMQEMGIDVLLEERTESEDVSSGFVTLRSGKKVACDFCVSAVGQKPSSGLLKDLAPNAITPSGHIRVKPTMQIDDDALPNIYACGDVIEFGVKNANARAAMKQAMYAADNVTLALRGQPPKHKYKVNFMDGVIKLTLGLDKSITHFGDGKTELLFHKQETDETLMVADVWRFMGATPYEDDDDKSKPAGAESTADKTREITNDLP
ncbi:hypothetical protein D7B24_007600 [Verticillium nonalfalfae]|uniref:Oxidoreductase n=2 Tax=Verticillium TaxID=1036719 RepID=C9SWJ1_VERA1|nr:oxidoreductase [Verticillium alfalfae VaMs.102]XP_028494375.1 uncharacterized protein D7B24_007600 [Verticillium nonalfalfae]EEY23156.1 oxidoreductase [Verticillium alfalfae VaMs.102]RNJ56217.1 hypothetical protein D7B24_007600 [Verticillium nonalfalfae]